MKLYKIQASNWETFFGTPENPIARDDVIRIAQTPSCDAFLFLSNQGSISAKAALPGMVASRFSTISNLDALK